MTQENADTLEQWMSTLDAAQLRLLWRWLFLAWVHRTEHELSIVRPR